MLSNLYRGTSWLALRSPDDDSGGAAAPAGGETPAAAASPASGADGGTGEAAAAQAAGTEGAGATAPASTDPASPEPAIAPKLVPAERIDRLTAEKWQERRARESAENALRLANETIEAMKRGTPAAPQTDENGEPIPPQRSAAAPATSPEALQRMATEIAQNKEFNDRVVASISQGRSDYTDFDTVAAKLQAYGDMPRPFVEALLETGKGHHVLYALANDPGEADRIFSITNPVSQAIAIERYAGKVAVKPPAKLVSTAPAPIAPKVGGSVTATPSLDDPNLPMSEWLKLREKSVAPAKRR